MDRSQQKGAVMEATELKGATVMAANGEKIGEVDEVLLNIEDDRIQALRVKHGGLFGGFHGLVDWEAVEQVGQDAIMIRDRSAVHSDRDELRSRQVMKLADLLSLPVITERGTAVGKVIGVQVDERTGKLTALEFAKSGLAGALQIHPDLLSMAEVRSIGHDAVMVTESDAT